MNEETHKLLDDAGAPEFTPLRRKVEWCVEELRNYKAAVERNSQMISEAHKALDAAGFNATGLVRRIEQLISSESSAESRADGAEHVIETAHKKLDAAGVEVATLVSRVARVCERLDRAESDARKYADSHACIIELHKYLDSEFGSGLGLPKERVAGAVAGLKAELAKAEERLKALDSDYANRAVGELHAFLDFEFGYGTGLPKARVERIVTDLRAASSSNAVEAQKSARRVEDLEKKLRDAEKANLYLAKENTSLELFRSSVVAALGRV